MAKSVQRKKWLHDILFRLNITNCAYNACNDDDQNTIRYGVFLVGILISRKWHLYRLFYYDAKSCFSIGSRKAFYACVVWPENQFNHFAMSWLHMPLLGWRHVGYLNGKTIIHHTPQDSPHSKVNPNINRPTSSGGKIRSSFYFFYSYRTYKTITKKLLFRSTPIKYWHLAYTVIFIWTLAFVIQHLLIDGYIQ